MELYKVKVTSEETPLWKVKQTVAKTTLYYNVCIIDITVYYFVPLYLSLFFDVALS